MLRRVRPVFEIVYESRGKLIGGSLSRERKANSRPSENEGGDNVQPPVLSDHGLIVATIPFIHQPALYITRQIRHWKSLDRDALADAFRDHPLFSNIETTPALTVTQLFDSYSFVTSELLDAFLPVRTVKSRHCPLTPRFDAECRLRRRQARHLERVFRRTQLASDKTT